MSESQYRKKYIEDVYSKYWISARDGKYGFADYDRALIEHLSESLKAGAEIFEVAIGTGYPYAAMFNQAGFLVGGIDIAPDLVAQCRQSYPYINAQVGDAEALAFDDNSFDLVYCVHSSWYFPDLRKAIAEMVRVTRPRGVACFDIQNSFNSVVSNYQKRLQFELKGVGRLWRYGKNFVKIVLKKGTPDWSNIIYETPSNPHQIIGWLQDLPCSFKMFAFADNQLIELDIEHSTHHWREYSKLIFTVTPY